MTLAQLQFIAKLLVWKSSIDDSTVADIVEDAIAKTKLLREYREEDARFRGVKECVCARCERARGLDDLA